jgi:pantothenate kinase
MTWSPLNRVVDFTRRSRDRREAAVHKATAAGQAHRRDPAITGYNVSASHGRHCICRRCEQLADRAA